MKNSTLAFLTVTAIIVAVLSGYVFMMNSSMVPHTETANMPNGSINTPQPLPTDSSKPTSQHEYAKGLIKPKVGQPIKKFTLTAMEVNLQIREGLIVPVWTYNGSVPGEEIRVEQGDFVQVDLKNELKEPVTIHWHGYPLLSAMDGVPGVNQDSVRPGETFTYEFSADVAGTYWYHSHQEGSKQVDKGLYGALIVEPKDKPKPDKDFTLILDEWAEIPMEEMGDMDKGGHGDMNMDENQDPVVAEEEMMGESYNIYTVNGRSGKLINPLTVKKGDNVRLRLINAGYRSHGIHIPGQDLRVVATDGQDIEGAGIFKDRVIVVAPGERYDVEFKVSSDNDFIIDAHDDNKYNEQVKILVKVEDGSGKLRIEPLDANLPIFDLASYGKEAAGQFTLDQNFDVDYNIELNTKVDSMGLKYTINGKTFPELPPLQVKTGDTIKLSFDNQSKVDHPMHLHGHFFQVLSKNDKAVSSVIMKDTLLVRPGEKYTVAFRADNAGRWVQHCHELHHAAAGMMMEIVYTDFKANYVADPTNTFNKPE